MLAGSGVAAGESGAAGLAGLIELLRGERADETRRRLGLNAGSRVLLLSTEGITDARNYERVVAGVG